MQSSTNTGTRQSLSSFPSTTTARSGSIATSELTAQRYSRHRPTHSGTSNELSSAPSHESSQPASYRYSDTIESNSQWQKPRPIRSQYPPDSTEKHVEYILVASFDIDRGSIMEHQYPGPVGGDEHMLAELMLPDQTHLRAQDWTIFFLHKDAEEEQQNKELKRQNRAKVYDEDGQEISGGESDDDSTEGDDDNFDGPPLVYVLNLVNTKQDNTVKRGAVVKAMAICTRHSFLHIYKPLLLLALEQYFASPTLHTLASLYDAVNSMDLSLMPRLNTFERSILQSTDAKDLFLEKFEAIIAQRMATNGGVHPALVNPSPGMNPNKPRYGLPKDTHEFETVVNYANVPVPIKVPTALSPETVGHFSLIKLITTFSTPHATSPQPFNPTHPQLTTSGATTHPIIVLLNALLTQKRVIFLGHNLPSSDVAEAVLGACALASGGVLRGFTRHAFPYTDLTKIDDLLKVPGFIAGVTNPAFAHKSEWWDVLCDLPTGRIRISNKIEAAPITEGVAFFQGNMGMPAGNSGPAGGISAIAAAGATLSAGLGGSAALGHSGGDPTGDVAFMGNVLAAIHERHGENAIRVKFRRWVVKFTSLAAAFEEMVYGASALQVYSAPPPETTPTEKRSDSDMPPEVAGHGYVWPSQQAKIHELAANATRIEGWRNTRSYYNFIQDLTSHYNQQPVKALDLHHLHDKLAKLRLGVEQSSNIYLAICAAVQTDSELNQLLSVVALGSWDSKAGPTAGGPGGLFFIAQGLFHPKSSVREEICGLLERIAEHDAGRHFFAGLGRFVKMGYERVKSARDNRLNDGDE